MESSLRSRKVTRRHGGTAQEAGAGGESGQDSEANQFLVLTCAFYSRKIEQ